MGDLITRRAKRALIRTPAAYTAAHRAQLYGRFLARRPNDPDFAAFAALPAREGVFLDVGANVGQSALSFRLFDRRRPIVSIEANPVLARQLRKIARIARPMTIHTVAAGAERGSLTLRVPTYRGLAITGEARVLERDEILWIDDLDLPVDDGQLSFHVTEVPVIALDELALAPAIVKMDIEGGEFSALQGMRQTLERHRPVLLIETPFQPVFDLLDDLGYTPRCWSASGGFAPMSGDEQNVFFLSETDLNGIE